MVDERWKQVEQVVAALEAALAPGARVEHNVTLPVVGRPDREPRQCDVVIYTGPPNRETLTIVEVQTRGKPPDINTFGGWVIKMREVGAQHLICVAEAGFPKSIIAEVRQVYGPTVRLMALKDIPALATEQFTLAPFMLHTEPRFECLEEPGPIVLDPKSPRTQLQIGGSAPPAFLVGDATELVTFEAAIAAVLNHQRLVVPPHVKVVDHRVDLGTAGLPLQLLIDGIAHRVVRLPVALRIVHERKQIPLQHLVYETVPQEVGGKLAWVATGVIPLPEGECAVRVVYTPTEDGFELMVSPQGKVRVMFADSLGQSVPVQGGCQGS